jgi:hypothetical protein
LPDIRLRLTAVSSVCELKTRNPQLLVDDSHWLDQIGIVGDDDKLLAIVAKGIGQHLGCDIDVGAFLLHLENLSEARAASARSSQWQGNLAL